MRGFREVHEQMGLPFDERRQEKLVGIPPSEQALMFAGGAPKEFHRPTFPLNWATRPRYAPFPATREMLTSSHTGLPARSRDLQVNRRRRQGLGQTRIRDRFDVVVTADDCHQTAASPRPDPEALKAARPARRGALYVGDILSTLSCHRGLAWTCRSHLGAEARRNSRLQCPAQCSIRGRVAGPAAPSVPIRKEGADSPSPFPVPCSSFPSKSESQMPIPRTNS